MISPTAERLRADWERLSEFRDPQQAGWTRRPFTAEYRAARCRGTAGIQLQHPLEVVDFLAEEPTDFGISCVGSRGMTGTLDQGVTGVRALGEAVVRFDRDLVRG